MAEKMLPPLVLELRAKASELIAEVKAAATETEKAAASMKASATEAEGAAAKTGAAAEETAAKGSAGWSKFMGVSKAAAVGVVGAAAVIGVESVKMAGDFQAQVTRLHTAAGESESNLKSVSDGILSIARATGTTTDEMTSGAYMVESAGYHGAKALEVLKAAAQGAKNEGADLGGTADALTTVMEDLKGKTNDTAATLMSKMVVAVGQGKMKMDDLAGSIHNVLPNAAPLGVTFEQVAGALATMTAEGVSADQASQNLNHTIVKLAAPTTAMSNAMAAYGVNSSDLKNNLGKNGLTGTFDILSKAILDHMGPSGLALQDTFNKSKVAASDVQKMLTSLPASLQTAAKGFLDGSVSAKQFTADIKGQGAAGAAQGAQFMALAKTANGFTDALKSGKDGAQTFNQAMYSMLGDQTGLQVALHLTGDHMQTFKDNVKTIGKASADANGNVKDWSVTQDTFNNRMARLRETVQTAAIAIGQKLLPPVSAFVGFLANHQGVVIAFASVLGVLLVGAATAYFAKITVGAAKNVIDFAKMVAAGVQWVAKTAVSIAQSLALWAMYAAEWIAKQSAAAAAWIAEQAAQLASWVAKTAVGIGQSLALWAMYAGEWIAKQAAAAATWVAQQAVQFAAWAAKIATQTAAAAAKWAAYTAAWLAQQSGAAATWVAEQGAAFATWVATQAAGFAESAAAGAAWIAEHIAMAGVAVVQYGIMAAAAVAAFIAENAATLGIAGLIALLVGAIVWLATHWSTAWDAIASAATWVYDNVIKPVAGFIVNVALKPIEAYLWVLKTVWGAVWDGIKTVVKDVWDFLKPIFDAIGKGISAVAGGVKAIGGFAGKVGGLLGFDNGGVVPGAEGAPLLAVVHGGEVVLSRDMLAGKQQPPDELLDATSANPYKPTTSTQRALAGSTSSSPPASSTSGGGGQTVIVNVATPASPSQIAAEVGWQLRKSA